MKELELGRQGVREARIDGVNQAMIKEHSSEHVVQFQDDLLLHASFYHRHCAGECGGGASREGGGAAEGRHSQRQAGGQVRVILLCYSRSLVWSSCQVHAQGARGDGDEVRQAEEGQAEAHVSLDFIDVTLVPGDLIDVTLAPGD